MNLSKLSILIPLILLSPLVPFIALILCIKSKDLGNRYVREYARALAERIL